MNLATRYMGLELKNPLVASASPLTAELGNIRQLEDSGAAAIVLPSIFEEQIEAEAQRYDHLTSAGSDSLARRPMRRVIAVARAGRTTVKLQRPSA